MATAGHMTVPNLLRFCLLGSDSYTVLDNGDKLSSLW